MLKPFLFVGVGGSGGKTLRALKQTLDRRLKQNDWDKGIPGAWQFVQVDATTLPDGIDFPAPMLSLEEFIGMVGPGQNYSNMVTALESRFPSSSDRDKALAGWLAPHAAVPIATGAGMVRTIGRAVSAAGLASMRSGLKNALDRMQAPENISNLIELSQVLHPKSGRGSKMGEPAVLIVSSIAGGSGAGMFLDVTETLKSLDPNADWLQNQLAFLYTPEVFDSISPTMRAQIPMNALGAMNEILAGLWADQASEATDLLFNASGVQVLRKGKKSAVGPAGIYLVGSRNANGVNIAKGNDGAGMDEVFLAVGEAISGLLTNEDISDKYNAYFYTNVFANSGKAAVLMDHSGLRRPSDTQERMPFGALGFARITLGMDRLMDYAAEGLSKEHVKTLLFPQFVPVDQLNPIRDAELIERAVTAHRDDFIRGSRLHETHPHDQVVNYLRGDEIDSPAWDAAPGTPQDTGANRKRRAQEYAMSCVPKNAQRPDATQSAAQWRTMLLQQSSALLPKFLSDQRTESEDRSQTWSHEIQKHLIDHAAKWIAQEGLQVTARLFKILRDDLKQIANQEMPAEAETMHARGIDFESAVSGRLGSGDALQVNSKEVRQALQALQVGAERLAEAQLLEYAPVLIKNVIKGVIEPLIEECEVAYALISQDISPSSTTGAGKLFRQFADLKADREAKFVSPRYMPRQVEKMLINANSFPVEFETIQKMDLDDDAKSSWVSITRELSMRGLPLRSRDTHVKTDAVQTLLKVVSDWVPEDVRAKRDSTLRAQQLEVRLPHTMEEVVDRNRNWLEDKESSFGRQYRMSIADYCNGGNKNTQHERQQTFLNSFTDVIQLSAPLISINDNAVQTFHNNPNPEMTPHGTHLILTDIPFAIQSQAGQGCVDILQRAGKRPDDYPFDAASTAKDLYGFSTVKAAMSPMVFSSLIEPISDAWLTSSSDPSSIHSFWDGRRARPLTDSLPMPPEIRLSMIVGWFVSLMFGEREKDASNEHRGIKWSVWDPTDGWVSFPHPLLPVSPLDRSPLPAVLKSLSLAIVEAGKLASPLPLAPYMRLKNLGREITADPRFGLDLNDPDTRRSSALIKDWVLEDKLPKDAPSNFKLDELSSALGNTPTNRRQVLVEEVRALRSEYDDVWASYEKHSWRDRPRLVEIQDDITQALDLLVQYCESLSISGASRISDN